jgi:hypothetical protein
MKKTLALMAGCSSMGHIEVTPTSYDPRVMILQGNAQGESTRFWVIGLGGLSDGAFEATKNAERAVGADLLLNPAVDTHTTSYLFGLVVVEKTFVRGLAVSFIPSYKSRWNGAAPAAAAPAATAPPAVSSTPAP